MSSLLSKSSAHSQPWADTIIQGVGLGLRDQHMIEVLTTQPNTPWFELLADNHLSQGGLIPKQLAAIREQYPVTLHCVGMSIGGTDALDFSYLSKIKQLKEKYSASWVSDHLAFTQFKGRHFHDLLPIPYNEESLQFISQRIDIIQDFFGEALLIENPSSYLSYSSSSLSEIDFILALVEETQCKLLLDINNVHVSAINHHFSAQQWLDKVPLNAVCEVHLAGYEEREGYLLDAHNNPVSDAVWTLYQGFAERCHLHNTVIPTLIEWDNDIPEFSVLQDEAKLAHDIMMRKNNA
ncbi:MAG: DUF692 domain-containing protein [Thiotrichaceae bacterium]|nr:DUF692 domain-containing protein [Thiotrichaceae bacterium]